MKNLLHSGSFSFENFEAIEMDSLFVGAILSLRIDSYQTQRYDLLLLAVGFKVVGKKC